MGATATSGTLSYMPPEKFSADKLVVKAGDIFSLGVTMYELLAGDLPFGNHGGLVLLSGAEVPNLPGNFSPDLNTLIKACMARNTWDRPTAAQLSKTAKDYLDNGRWSLPVTETSRDEASAKFDPQATRVDSKKAAQEKPQPIEPADAYQNEKTKSHGGIGKKTLIIIPLLLILVVAAWFVFNRPPSEDPQARERFISLRSQGEVYETQQNWELALGKYKEALTMATDDSLKLKVTMLEEKLSEIALLEPEKRTQDSIR